MATEGVLVSAAELERHTDADSLWVAIRGVVYDVTRFARLHPGGAHVLRQSAGKDATAAFELFHNSSILRKFGPKLAVGRLADYEDPAESRMQLPGAFGDLVPYADPAWYQRFNSPFYSDSHRQWRQYVRGFLEAEIFPTLPDWRESERPPPGVTLALGRAGLLAAMVGNGWPRAYCGDEANQHEPAGFDQFHELILFDEISRCGDSACISAMTNGCAIGLSAIQSFGSDALKQRVMPGVLAGERHIALAVSEPNAGSDVAGMACVARTSDCGGYFVVHGNKKWITGGTYADFFVTALVTGDPGQGGLTLVVVDRDTEGFSTRKVNVRGSHASGTAYLDFDGARVPRANVIGEENSGFRLIMHNFNHERFYMCAMMSRLSRVCLEESVKYALKRRTFGRALHEHQAIRLKVASMARACEQFHTWLELLTYQMCTMEHEEAMLKIGDVMCLAKAQGSKVYELCARETTMIFGGNALYVGGVGDKIESAVMQVKAYQIPAGAEDVMDDFGARSAFKLAKRLAKL